MGPMAVRSPLSTKWPVTAVFSNPIDDKMSRHLAPEPLKISMPLARKLRLIDYFALGFGVMVGTAWLVVMDDILQRGGPLGAVLGLDRKSTRLNSSHT